MRSLFGIFVVLAALNPILKENDATGYRGLRKQGGAQESNDRSHRIGK